MNNMNFSDKQTAFEYSFYMISASYFDKAVCMTTLSEKNMLLHYKEQKVEAQYRMEDFCIRYMNELEKHLGKDFFRQEMEVHLRRPYPGKPFEIMFNNESNWICFNCCYKGKQSEITYEYGLL